MFWGEWCKRHRHQVAVGHDAVGDRGRGDADVVETAEFHVFPLLKKAPSTTCRHSAPSAVSMLAVAIPG